MNCRKPSSLLAQSVLLALAGAIVGCTSSTKATEPAPKAVATTQPVLLQPTTRASASDTAKVREDYMKAMEEVNKVLPATAMKDPALRQEAAPKAIPAIHARMAAFDKLAVVNKLDQYQLDQVQMSNKATLYLLGDSPTIKAVDAEAASDNSDQKVSGQSVQILAKWMDTHDNTEQTNTIASQVIAMDTASPDSNTLTELTINMLSAPHDPASSTLLRKMPNEVMTSEHAKATKLRVAAFLKHLTDQRTQMQASTKTMKEKYEGKPMVIAGKTLDGKEFTTADLKGKVVLVDFWAVWCGPCVASLPHVKEVYEKYHGQGLEIVGVDNDEEAEKVTKFLETKQQLPWTQLFVPSTDSKNNFSPITRSFGIIGIPTMFLIDKQGNCRSVEAREKMEELVPKMLAEQG